MVFRLGNLITVNSVHTCMCVHLLCVASPCQRIKLTSKPVCGGQRSLGPKGTVHSCCNYMNMFMHTDVTYIHFISCTHYVVL